MSIIDPIDYARSKSLIPRIAVPSVKEEKSARHALSDLFSLFYDCPLFCSIEPREKRRFVNSWINESIRQIDDGDFFSFLIKLAKLGNLFLRSFTWKGDVISYDPHPSLLESPITSAILSLKKVPMSDGRYFNTIRWILTVHLRLSKLPLTRDDLTDTSESDWIMRQLLVKDIADVSIDTIEALQNALEWLYDADMPEAVLGKHGPGSTAQRAKTIPEKEELMFPSQQSLSLVPDSISWIPFVLLKQPLPNWLEFVPKDIKSLRPITMESVSMQFAQQAYKRVIYEHVDSGFVRASHHITFNSQEASRRAALRGSTLRGSRMLRQATIDLSSASDLLSVGLVANIFPKNLLHILLCGRSWDTVTTHGNIELRMYGGMGSALTFPVQTLVFTALCYVAVARALSKRELGGCVSSVQACEDFIGSPAYWYAFKPIIVFGDDIIIPEFAVSDLYKLLDEVGLRVNVDKSFTGDLVVREACGMFAFAGEDITPARYRIPPMRKLADFAYTEASRAVCNHAFYLGYRTLYRHSVRHHRGLKLFMGKDERLRQHQYVNTSALNQWQVTKDPEIELARKKLLAEKRRRVGERIKLTDVEVLFESPRGDPEGHIGVVSARQIRQGSVQIVYGREEVVQTSYTGKTDTTVDDAHDYYYYAQDRYILEHNEVQSMMHGRIPDGIRLVKRAAILLETEEALGWSWVSS